MSLSSVSNTALSGIRAAEAMLEVAADNLANLQTPGFKQSQVQLATRAPVGSAPGLQIGTGVQVVGIARDSNQGALLPAGGQFQLAIKGEGFFVLEDAQGQRLYSRDGTFQLNAEGQLVSSAGHRVLGWQGDRNVFQGELTPLFILEREAASQPSLDGTQSLPGNARFRIGLDGRIQSTMPNGSTRTLGQIRLAQFANPGGLRAVGQNAYVATASSGAAHVGNPQIDGLGHLATHTREASTTDIAQNIISMSRAELLFRANLKVLSVADRLWQELLDMGRR